MRYFTATVRDIGPAHRNARPLDIFGNNMAGTPAFKGHTLEVHEDWRDKPMKRDIAMPCTDGTHELTVVPAMFNITEIGVEQ